MKSLSFEEYLDLLKRTAERFELAMGTPHAPREKLRKSGWQPRAHPRTCHYSPPVETAKVGEQCISCVILSRWAVHYMATVMCSMNQRRASSTCARARVRHSRASARAAG